MTVDISYFCAGNAKETDTHEHASYCDLIIAELDTIQVLDAQAICGDEAVQRENLVHLNGCNQGAPALANDIRNLGRSAVQYHCS